ncbi:MAG: PAS domain S-box protein [Candidatus Methanoperedens sp.]|nr:PAS domain S-box protein [Candidatus Methanoperedens sp.]
MRDEVHLLPKMILEISEAKDFQSAIEVALKNICEITGWNYGDAWIRSSDESVLERIPAAYCSSGSPVKFKELSEKFTFPLGTGMPGRIWLSKKYEWVPDVSLVSKIEFPRAKFARKAGFRACLGVPIIAGDEVLAVLVFLMFESREEEMRFVDFISGAAAELGSVIQRKKAEEQRRAASLYARNLIEASLDPLVTISPEGKIMDVNKATEGITGIPRERLIGTDFSDYFTEPENARRGYHQVFSDGYVRDYPLSIRNISGNIIDVLYNATVYRDENGQILGVFAAARDISQIKQAEEEIRKLNAQLERRITERTRQLEAANKELEAFSYSVSHDLRAPLRSIDGFSQALLEDYGGVLDAQAKDYLTRVRSASQRMSQLIDDMLVLSRVTRREMKRSAVDLSALANMIAAELLKAQPQRRVEFNISPGLVVNGDAELLRAMLENLLGNAWKFTSTRQSATIEFGVKDLDGKPSYFVRDNGVGFDMAYASKLFQAFQRLHLQTDFPGTGIGLATVKRIINRHGGRIWAESEAGKGATFYFNL